MAITTLVDFREYLKLVMGKPVINVEVADSQIDQIIEDSVQDFHRYTYGEATYRDVLVLPLSAGTSAYQLDESVESILDISLTSATNDINTLFTPQHTLLYNDWIMGNYPGGPGGGGAANLGGAMAMGNYDIGMIYLKEIEDHFTRKYTCSYSTNTQTIRIWPTPNVNTVGLLQVYRRETATALYNNSLLKKLAKARCMILWGIHLNKYAMSLPGGGTINGASFIEKGERDEEKALDAIVKESHPPVFVIG